MIFRYVHCPGEYSGYDRHYVRLLLALVATSYSLLQVSRAMDIQFAIILADLENGVRIAQLETRKVTAALLGAYAARADGFLAVSQRVRHAKSRKRFHGLYTMAHCAPLAVGGSATSANEEPRYIPAACVRCQRRTLLTMAWVVWCPARLRDIKACTSFRPPPQPVYR